jgi:hypothetical protein
MTYLKTLYEGDESATDFLITLGAGSAHMLSDAVAFTMAFDFNIEQYKPDGANAWISGRYFDFKLGFSFFLY